MGFKRRFILREFPADLECTQFYKSYLGYLACSDNVDVGFACDEQNFNFYNHRLIITSMGMFKSECEIPIDKVTYQQIFDCILPKWLILFHCKLFDLSGGLILEYNHVDPYSTSNFKYADIEFQSEEEAKAYIPTFHYLADVTYDSYWKMRSYWERTRPDL